MKNRLYDYAMKVFSSIECDIKIVKNTYDDVIITYDGIFVKDFILKTDGSSITFKEYKNSKCCSIVYEKGMTRRQIDRVAKSIKTYIRVNVIN